MVKTQTKILNKKQLNSKKTNKLVELRLVPGDELRLRNNPDSGYPPYNCVGHVIKILRKL